ncbi:MAG: MFS transporter, partial [Pseudolabrys sp.]|nr:MFS transporter [Pseudolabrys sp.]
MTTTGQTAGQSGGSFGLLDRERIVAQSGFNRWLVPPAALCIHLCIGMAYGFSVFWLPLSRAIGITAPKVCADMSIAAELFTTTCDWRVASLALLWQILRLLGETGFP